MDITDELMAGLGELVYEKEKVTQEQIGEYICPSCGKTSCLIKRKGELWEYVVSECKSCPYTETIKKHYHSKYQVGDKIRVYESTFSKDSRIILNTYREGTVTKIYPDIGGYYLDYVIERDVKYGKETPKTSWVIGSTITGRRHVDRCIKLIG